MSDDEIVFDRRGAVPLALHVNPTRLLLERRELWASFKDVPEQYVSDGVVTCLCGAQTPSPALGGLAHCSGCDRIFYGGKNAVRAASWTKPEAHDCVPAVLNGLVADYCGTCFADVDA